MKKKKKNVGRGKTSALKARFESTPIMGSSAGGNWFASSNVDAQPGAPRKRSSQPKPKQLEGVPDKAVNEWSPTDLATFVKSKGKKWGTGLGDALLLGDMSGEDILNAKDSELQEIVDEELEGKVKVRHLRQARTWLKEIETARAMQNSRTVPRGDDEKRGDDVPDVPDVPDMTCGPATYTLSGTEKDGILGLVNNEMTANSILQMLAPQPGAKQDAVQAYLDRVIRKAQPPPTGLRRCGVRLAEGEPSLPLYHYPGKRKDATKHYKTFLVLGATGVGKTTLMDAFVNTLSDVTYKDTWRYKLVNEDRMLKKTQGFSMTDKITYYYIEDKRRDGSERCHVKIIDTPGFGDVRGPEYDHKIAEQFEKLFKTEIDTLDYILLVVKAPMTRWTARSQYIYQQVQKVFGADAKRRFILMCTFADGGKPNALGILKNHLHWETYFSFNNSALYTPSGTPTAKTNNTKMYWDICTGSVNKFLKYVTDQRRSPLSLSMTKENIQTQKYLFDSIANAQRQISIGFSKLDDIKTTLAEIERNRDIINKTGALTTTQTQIKTRLVRERFPGGAMYQMCTECETSCCQVCKWPANETESVCTYFGSAYGYKCTCGHGKSTHIRSVDKITKETYEVTETFEVTANVQQKRRGEQGLSTAQRLFNSYKRQIQTVFSDIVNNMQRSKDCLTKLDSISMCKFNYSNADYFEQMIKTEEATKEAGYQKRVKYLQTMVKRARTLDQASKVNGTADLSKLFPSYAQLLRDVQS